MKGSAKMWAILWHSWRAAVAELRSRLQDAPAWSVERTEHGLTVQRADATQATLSLEFTAYRGCFRLPLGLYPDRAIDALCELDRLLSRQSPERHITFVSTKKMPDNPCWFSGVFIGNAHGLLKGVHLDCTGATNTATHLVLTGPNGSGKTVLLDALAMQLDQSGSREYARRRQEANNYDVYFKNAAAEHPELMSWIRTHEPAWVPPDRASIFDIYRAFDSALEDGSLPNTIPGSDARDKFADLWRWFGDRRRVREELAEMELRDVCIAAELPLWIDPSALVVVRVDAASMETMVATEGMITPRFQGGGRGVEGFLDTLVSARAERALTKEAGDLQRADELSQWLAKVEEQFQALVGPSNGQPGLRLVFDASKLTYGFEHSRTGPVPPSALPSGLRRIINIWAKILMQWDLVEHWAREIAAPDALAGWVLIDEPEAHLHAELQEKIMPFLTRTFPRLQFIVATHSPEVVASMDDAVIYDLRNSPPARVLARSLYGQKYDRLLTKHFGLSAPWSVRAEEDVARLTELDRIAEPSAEDVREMKGIMERFENAPAALAYRVWERIVNPREGAVREHDDD